MNHVARRFVLITGTLAAAVAAPRVARAQLAGSTMQLNIAAGAALPTGSLGDATDVGYNLTVGIGSRPHNSQLGFRAEGMYNEFGITNTSLKAHAGGVTGNVTVDLANGALGAVGNSLYLIGGAGYYSTAVFNNDSRWDVGYNLGAGFRFPLSGFSAYFEGRYHTISGTDVKFVPLVFGLVF